MNCVTLLASSLPRSVLQPAALYSTSSTVCCRAVVILLLRNVLCNALLSLKCGEHLKPPQPAVMKWSPLQSFLLYYTLHCSTYIYETPPGTAWHCEDTASEITSSHRAVTCHFTAGNLCMVGMVPHKDWLEPDGKKCIELTPWWACWSDYYNGRLVLLKHTHFP